MQKRYICILFVLVSLSRLACASPVSWIDSQWFGVGDEAEFGAGANASYNLLQSLPDQVAGSVSSTVVDFPIDTVGTWSARSKLAFARRFTWGHLDGQIMQLQAKLTGGINGNSPFSTSFFGFTDAGYSVGAYIAKLDSTQNCSASEVAISASNLDFNNCTTGIITNIAQWPFSPQVGILNGNGLGYDTITMPEPVSVAIDSLTADAGSGMYVAVGYLDATAFAAGPIIATTDGTDSAYVRSLLTLQIDVNRAVPEPAMLPLLLIAFLALGACRASQSSGRCFYPRQ